MMNSSRSNTIWSRWRTGSTWGPVLAALVLTACGGGADEHLAVKASTAPTEDSARRRALDGSATQTEVATDAERTVIRLYQALEGKAPSHEVLKRLAAQSTTNGASALAFSMASEPAVAALSDAALALRVLGNLSINETTVSTPGSYAILLSALEQMFAGYGRSARGQIILNASTLLASLQSDAVWGAASTAFVSTLGLNQAYAKDPANLISAVLGPIHGPRAGLASLGVAMAHAAVSIQPLPVGAGPVVTLRADASGRFTIPATTTLPAMVQATSNNELHTHFSYIRSARQEAVGVNPLTTLVMALAARGHPSSLNRVLTSAELEAAQAAAFTVVKPVLDAAASPVRDLLTAHVGDNSLDVVLHSLGVDVSSAGEITVTNKLTGAPTRISPSNVQALTLGSRFAQAIRDEPLRACATLLNGLTQQRLLSDLKLYDASFLDSGRRRADFLVEISGGVPPFRFSMPVFSGMDANGHLRFDVQIENPVTGGAISDYGVTVKRGSSGAEPCVLVGDQFPFEITIQPAIKSTIRLDGLSTNAVNQVAGLEIYVGAHLDWEFATNDLNGTRIRSARVEVCNAASVCRLLTTLRNADGAAKGIFDIEGTDALNTMRMLRAPNLDLATDISNPIRITFFSSTTAPLVGDAGALGIVHTRSTGRPFEPAEVRAIQMPSVENPELITRPLDNPVIRWNAGSGVATEITLTTFKNSQVRSAGELVLSSGRGSLKLTLSDAADASYRAVSISAHLKNRPGILETKYIWAPDCPTCH